MSEMINPQVFADFNKLATHAWRHSLKVRHLFSDKPTHESMDGLLRCVTSEIKRAVESELRHRDSDESGYYIQQLQSLESDFDVLIGSNDMDIDNLVQQFDYCLSELYDLGDSKIKLRDGKLQKFMWIG